MSARARECFNDRVVVYSIDADTQAEVFIEAHNTILDLRDEFGHEPYSNLVIQQVDEGCRVLYSGVLYVHVW